MPLEREQFLALHYVQLHGKQGINLKEKRQKLIEKMEAFRFRPIADELYAYYDLFEALIEREDSQQQKEDYLLLGFYRGETFFRLGKYEKALKCFSDCLYGQTEEADSAVMANIYNILGLIHSTMGYQLLALDQYLKACEYAARVHDYRKIVIIQVNIGWLYSDIGDYDSSLRYYKKSLEDMKKIRDDNGYSLEVLVLSYIGQIYFKTAQYEEGVRIVNELEKHTEKERGMFYQVSVQNLNILGYTYTNEKEKCMENIDRLIENAKRKEDFLEFSEAYFDICRFIIDHYREKARQFLDVLTMNCEHFGLPYYLMKLKKHEVMFARKYESYQRYLECAGDYFEYERRYNENSMISVSSSMEMIEKLEKMKKERTLYFEQSRRDLMTDLLNKVTFENTVERFLQRKEEHFRKCALAVIDIDNFKKINDSHGHSSGDQIILDVVHHMKEVFGSDAILGRIGGDEFAVFWPEIDGKYVVYGLLDDMMEAVNGSHNSVCPFSISIGVAFTKVPLEYSVFFQKADNGLYDAKNNGKNTVKELA
jgi:diguanylate cyclase (GGDEF)-like protein